MYFEKENEKFLAKYPTDAAQIAYYSDKVWDVLSEFEIDGDFSMDGIVKNVDIWLDSKRYLMNMLRKHEQWNEEAKAIVFTQDELRELDEEVYYDMRSQLLDIMPPTEHGYKLRNLLRCLIPEQYLSEKQCLEFYVTDNMPDLKPGTKMSRIWSRVLREYPIEEGITNDLTLLPTVNSKFAKLADALNPVNITRLTILSVNILDYLLMSNGNSWLSCHYINSNGIFHSGVNGNYSGCYKAGCLSYANDETSMVFYTLPNEYEGSKWYREPKITRQMFSYSNGLLLQQRLYPRGGDSSESSPWITTTAKNYRSAVQKIIADSLNVSNLWTNSSNITIGERVIAGEGALNYSDYNQGGFFKHLCYLNEVFDLDAEDGAIEVGAAAYCVNCGWLLDEADDLQCDDCRTPSYRCYRCEEIIENDDEDEILHGYHYHRDCLNYCDECDEYVDDDVTWVHTPYGERDLCDSCYNDLNCCYCSELGDDVSLDYCRANCEYALTGECDTRESDLEV